MKKTVIFVVLAMVVVGFCAAQSANDAQRIVGTWVSEEGYTFVFNANGTGTGSGFSDSYSSLNGNFFWGVSISGEIGIKITRGTFVRATYLSPDSRRMIWNDSVFQKK